MSQTVVDIASHPARASSATTCRVAPLEAKWIRVADESAAREAQRFHRSTTGIRAKIEAADHALHELLERYRSGHRVHLDFGLQGFDPIVAPNLYWVLLLPAALLEAPVNNSALSFLGMSPAGTWAVAGFLSILNVVAASVFGKRLRQLPRGRPIRDWVLLGALPGIYAALMVALALLRADFIAFEGAQQGLPTSGGTLPTLMLLPALFFAVGAILSFNMVPADARLGRALADKQQLRRAIDRRLRERGTLVARHDQLWHEAQDAIAAARNHCMVLVAEYRDGNMAARVSAAPAWLRQALDSAVFAPVTLNPLIGMDTPPLVELLEQVERRAAAAVAV